MLFIQRQIKTITCKQYPKTDFTGHGEQTVADATIISSLSSDGFTLKKLDKQEHVGTIV